MFCSFFFSSRRRHTRCALVTGVQTCALPILARTGLDLMTAEPARGTRRVAHTRRGKTVGRAIEPGGAIEDEAIPALVRLHLEEIGRASSRERVCQYVEI